MTTPAASRKNRYGSRVYPVPLPGTEQVVDLPSVTHLLKVLAAPGLEIWKQKLLAEQFSLRPDLVMLAANPDTRFDAIKAALSAGQSAANQGTAVHYFTEMVDDGTLDWGLVPAPAKPWVENYVNARNKFGWTLVEKEFTVYSHKLGYAGTSDRILDVPGYGLVIADVKTSASVHADMALQLSFYAHADAIWSPPAESDLTESIAREAELEDWIANGTNIPEGRRKWSEDAVKVAKAELAELRWKEYSRKGTHRPLPAELRKDVALILHVGEKYCELVPLDLNGTLEVVTGISAINRWKERKDVVGQPVKVDPAVAVQELQQVVAGLSGEAPSADQKGDPDRADASPPPALEVPVSAAPDIQTRRRTAQARIDALTQEGKQKLLFIWPEGVPTLKRSDDHTPAQLQAIEDALWDVECEMAADKLASSFPGSTVS